MGMYGGRGREWGGGGVFSWQNHRDPAARGVDHRDPAVFSWQNQADIWVGRERKVSMGALKRSVGVWGRVGGGGEEGSRAGQAEEGRGARLRRGSGWLGHGVRGSRAHAVRG
jgi:hypothetical protein